VWTQGGYQVGREPDDYPLFLAVREQDVDAWETFFESFDLPTAFERQPQDELDGPLQIVLEPRASLDIEHVEGYPVILRAETIEYMRENYALELLEELTQQGHEYVLVGGYAVSAFNARFSTDPISSSRQPGLTSSSSLEQRGFEETRHDHRRFRL